MKPLRSPAPAWVALCLLGSALLGGGCQQTAATRRERAVSWARPRPVSALVTREQPAPPAREVAAESNGEIPALPAFSDSPTPSTIGEATERSREELPPPSTGAIAAEPVSTLPAVPLPQPLIRTEVEIAADWQALGAEVEVDADGRILSLDAAYRPVTNRDLESLPLLGSIKHLNLRGCSVDDEAARFIAPAATLQFVGLSQTRITDAGLEPLLSLPNLRYLSLADTYLTDAAIGTLSRFSNLLGLNLQGTALTDEGLDELRTLLPGCEIVCDTEAVDISSFVEDHEESECFTAFYNDREATDPRTASAAESVMPLRQAPELAGGPYLVRAPATESAEQRLRRQLESALLDPQLLAAAGDLHCERQEYSAAAEAYRTALRLSDDSESLALKLGVALANTGDNDAARELLTGYFGAAAAEYQLGRVYYQQGLTDECRTALETSLAMDPGYQPSQELLATLAHGNVPKVEGHHDESNATLQVLLQALAVTQPSAAENDWGIAIRPGPAPRVTQSSPQPSAGSSSRTNQRKSAESGARQATYQVAR
jgi:tetratricopeptide (TPR) repeat protein